MHNIWLAGQKWAAEVLNLAHEFQNFVKLA